MELVHSNSFNRFAAEHVSYAIQHFIGELKRVLGVLDIHLADRKYLVGNKFSIAGIAVFASVDVPPTA